MPTGIPFPNISPEMFSFAIGGIHIGVKWYMIAFAVSFFLALFLAIKLLSTPRLWARQTPPMTVDQFTSMAGWLVLGVVAGGRIGYILFYDASVAFEIPFRGLSFHGGFAGVCIAALTYSLRNRLPLLSVADLLALIAPIGLFLVRIANFINVELWGRPTDKPWGVIFPGIEAQTCPGIPAGGCARHPSQLYEAGLEGLVLGVILMTIALAFRGLSRPGLITSVFLVGYASSRMFVELYRQADRQFITATNPYGYVISVGDYGLSMGQLLCLPMIAAGALIWIFSRGKPLHATS